MSDIYVKDRNGLTIGYIRDMGSQLVATNYKKGYAGYYYKNTDITFDKNGRIYCHGDGTQCLVRELENKR